MSHEPAILKSAAGKPMTLDGVTARGTLHGLLFELTVEQRYRNPGAKNIEAVYTFPLPFEAVLLDLDVELNGRKLSAVVVEKKEAEGRYEEAIDKGDSAIMLERAGDGLCTLNLGNLMAGESAIIRYRYAQLLRFEHGSVRLAVPTVIAPRYGDPKKGGLDSHQIPVTDLAAEYPFALTLDLHGDTAAEALSSPSHPIATETTMEGVRVTLAKGAFLDRDFVLNVAGLSGRSLTVVARDGERYVTLASFCADVPRNARELPLRVKLLVDCSGSMSGDSIEAARRALHRILAGLAPVDRFALSRFGSQVLHETKTLVIADAPQIRAASERVGRMDADLGGTEMESALRSVFALGGVDAAADVLLVTDGEIWNADSLINEARAARQRVFVVGIGSAPAEGVLKRLAEASGGACQFVAPNEDAEGAILRMFLRLRAPRVERADIAWPSAPTWTTPVSGALFGGETVHAFAGFDAAPSGIAVLRLVPRGDTAALTAQASLPSAVVVDRTLARIAAARRIESATEEEQLRLALDYGLLTARTNLLVVHERADAEKAKDLPILAAVAQMHAAGWHGIGTVRREMLMCADLADFDFCDTAPVACDASPEFDALDVPDPSPIDAKGTPPSIEPHQASQSVDRDYAGLGFGLTGVPHVLNFLADRPSGALPKTLAEFAFMLPDELIRELRELIAFGHEEADVVRALLEALGKFEFPFFIGYRTPRRLARALRNQFKAQDECAALREKVSALLAATRNVVPA